MSRGDFACGTWPVLAQGEAPEPPSSQHPPEGSREQAQALAPAKPRGKQWGRRGRAQATGSGLGVASALFYGVT